MARDALGSAAGQSDAAFRAEESEGVQEYEASNDPQTAVVVRDMIAGMEGKIIALLGELAYCLGFMNAGIVSGDLATLRVRWATFLEAALIAVNDSSAHESSATLANTHVTSTALSPKDALYMAPSQASGGDRKRRLTAREREVLSYAVEGMPYKKIARKLRISEQTVSKHLKNARRKQRSSDGQTIAFPAS